MKNILILGMLLVTPYTGLCQRITQETKCISRTIFDEFDNISATTIKFVPTKWGDVGNLFIEYVPYAGVDLITAINKEITPPKTINIKIGDNEVLTSSLKCKTSENEFYICSVLNNNVKDEILDQLHQEPNTITYQIGSNTYVLELQETNDIVDFLDGANQLDLENKYDPDYDNDMSYGFGMGLEPR